MPSWLWEIFPSSARFSAVALGYNIAQAAFGGTAPVILVALAEADPSSTNFSLGLYMLAIATGLGIHMKKFQLISYSKKVQQFVW
jgi:MFS transporter, MHS family, proline/betaine transporter